MSSPSPLSALRARLEAEKQAQQAYNEACANPSVDAGRRLALLRRAEALEFDEYPRSKVLADLRWCVEEIERLQAEVASLRGRHTGYLEGLAEALPYRDREMWRRGRQGLCCGCGHSFHVEGCPVERCGCEG